MKDNTHQVHTQSSQQGEYGMKITTAKWYSGTLGDLKFPDICLTGEEKPRKNLTQETSPDRGSNPGPLRDTRACYHLLHSGGQIGSTVSISNKNLSLSGSHVWKFLFLLICDGNILNKIKFCLCLIPHGPSENFYGDRNWLQGIYIQYVCIYIYRVFHEALPPVTEHVPDVIWKHFS